MNPKVDRFIEKVKSWHDETVELRRILLELPLVEELKWGQPCYTFNGKNVVLIGGFKEYTTLLLFKGALLPDPNSILVTAGSTQAGRQMRFTSLAQIRKMEKTIRLYLHEAIAVERAGLKVKLKEHSEYEAPEELVAKFAAMPALKAAFEALTPGRQRAYYLHIAGAKQTKTRIARIENHVERILEGKGLND